MAVKKPRLLFVDDDPDAPASFAAAVAGLGPAELVCESSTSAALARLDAESFSAAVLVSRALRLDGLALLRELRRRDLRLPVVVITDRPNLVEATAAIRLGAGDYLALPLDPSALVAALGRLVHSRRLDAEHELLRRHVERPYSFDDIIGTSPAMRRVYETIEQVADKDVDVLVVGETGTGKELVARSIHRRSRRSSKPFVPVDCGAIPENLLEGEFFGHERGAFTGADRRRIGLLEFADEGTFFLDELAELPLLLQAKLLRTLQERRVRRVGGTDEIEIDVRVVAATARDLDQMVREQRFRKDLYYRINVIRIDLPRLADRGDDLGLLTEYFARRYSREMGKAASGITPEAYQVLAQYSWPGNVRELQNVIKRAIALSHDSMIGLGDLPDALVVAAGRRDGQAGAAGPAGYFALRDGYLNRFEVNYLRELLTRHHGDVKLAAGEARLPRGTLYRLMKNHGLDSEQFKH